MNLRQKNLKEIISFKENIQIDSGILPFTINLLPEVPQAVVQGESDALNPGEATLEKQLAALGKTQSAGMVGHAQVLLAAGPNINLAPSPMRAT